MTVRIAGSTGPKPWHLFTEEERAITTSIMRLCSSENPRAGNVPPPEPWMQEINDSMLALLDAAAPYPDEALMFEMHAEDVCRLHVCLVDIGLVHQFVIDECGECRATYWPCLRPLTIAAHEAMEMFQ